MGKAANSLTVPEGAPPGTEATLPPTKAEDLLNAIKPAETKLRKFLSGHEMQLPERQLPKEPEEPTKADANPKQDVDAAVVPISINDDGTVKETVATRAHDMEVAVGSHVVVDTPKGNKRKFVVFELKEDLMSVECLDESGDCIKLGLPEF